jgi:hypothetical protein
MFALMVFWLFPCFNGMALFPASSARALPAFPTQTERAVGVFGCRRVRFHLPIATCAVAVPFGRTRCNVGPFLTIAHGAFPARLPVGYHLLSGLIHGHTLYLLFLRLIGLSGALRPALFAACPAFRSAFDISDAVRGVDRLTFLVGLQY